jgi:toxin-antitoxin system PIN domain toxin
LIAVDTNILVHAHRRDSLWHEPAAARMGELAQGNASWALPWPCLHEFFAVVTHRKVFSPPSTAQQAGRQISAWLESPTVVLLNEADGYWMVLQALLERSRISGPRVHGARIAALCQLHGVRELWTADRDFSAFPGLTTRNPLI